MRRSNRRAARPIVPLTRGNPPPRSRALLPRRLTARLRTLTPSIVVRIHAGHPSSRRVSRRGFSSLVPARPSIAPPRLALGALRDHRFISVAARGPVGEIFVEEKPRLGLAVDNPLAAG